MSRGRSVKVAGIQFSCKIGDKEANLQRALGLIDKASKDEAEILLLPELFTTEYICFCRRDFKVFKYAEPIPGPTTKRIAKIEKQ